MKPLEQLDNAYKKALHDFESTPSDEQWQRLALSLNRKNNNRRKNLFILSCFLLFGIALRWLDMRAAARLSLGDQWGCARWLLPAIGLIQPGGQMSEVIGSTAAFAVFGTIVHHLLFKKFYDVGLAQPVGQMNRRSSGSRRRYT